MSDVEAQAVEWLWPPYIPLGKATMLDGDPGAGKSILTIEIASRISRGERLPGMSKSPTPATVLMLAMEDGAEDTIRPRLDASGADVSRVHLIDKELPLDESGVKGLKAEVVRLGAKLVIIDPLNSYLPDGVTSNDTTKVRRVINRLVSLAAETGAAILIVRHLNKGQGSAIQRGAGAMDIIAGCRSGLMVGHDPHDENKSILAHYKHNLSKAGPSLAFTVDDTDGKFTWLGTSSLRADDLVAPPEDADSRTAVEDALEFLRVTLADGPVLSAWVYSRGEKEKHSEASLKRAKKALGVRSRKAKKGEEHQGQWFWELPPNPQENQGAQTTAP